MEDAIILQQKQYNLLGLPPESLSETPLLTETLHVEQCFFLFFLSVSVHYNNRIKQIETAFPIHRFYFRKIRIVIFTAG